MAFCFGFFNGPAVAMEEKPLGISGLVHGFLCHFLFFYLYSQHVPDKMAVVSYRRPFTVFVGTDSHFDNVYAHHPKGLGFFCLKFDPL